MKYSEITTFEQWKEICHKEYTQLYNVFAYLNDKGQERYYAFGNLYDLANFCESASELVEWIDSKEGLDEYQVKRLDDDQAARAIAKLRRIAEKEG